jgi:hypothetical protein
LINVGWIFKKSGYSPQIFDRISKMIFDRYHCGWMISKFLGITHHDIWHFDIKKLCGYKDINIGLGYQIQSWMELDIMVCSYEAS